MIHTGAHAFNFNFIINSLKIWDKQNSTDITLIWDYMNVKWWKFECSQFYPNNYNLQYDDNHLFKLDREIFQL